MANNLRHKIANTERQTDQLIDRIVDAAHPGSKPAYEKRIAELENEKLLDTKKMAQIGKPQRPFGEMFELSMAFLSNPGNSGIAVS